MKQQSHQTRPKSQKSPRKGEKVWHPLFSFLTSFPEKNFFNCFYIQLALPTGAAATEEAKSACGNFFSSFPFSTFRKEKFFFRPGPPPLLPIPQIPPLSPLFFPPGRRCLSDCGQIALSNNESAFDFFPFRRPVHHLPHRAESLHQEARGPRLRRGLRGHRHCAARCANHHEPHLPRRRRNTGADKFFVKWWSYQTQHVQ